MLKLRTKHTVNTILSKQNTTTLYNMKFSRFFNLSERSAPGETFKANLLFNGSHLFVKNILEISATLLDGSRSSKVLKYILVMMNEILIEI